MESYEQKQMSVSKEDHKSDRLETPILQYFWQASPLSRNRQNSIHQFLRGIKVYDQFSDYELKLLSNFLHRRVFAPEEIIFKESERAFGFYMILDGHVDIYATKKDSSATDKANIHVVQLGKYDYFGELSLLEINGRRNASARAHGNTTLLAIFAPDLEELIERHPVVAAKLLQSISFIVAKRFTSVASELNALKTMINRNERESNDTNTETK